jgi:uncharacterized damage-inducible protein DinB
MPSANMRLSSSVIWLLDPGDAHQRARDVLRGFPPGLYGERPLGFTHSAWQLVEHLRIAQEDILRYCVDREYRSPQFPEGYWPKQPEPPDRASWALSARAFLTDLRAAQRLARAHEDDLLAPLPHAAKVTWLDELLIIADHNSYHLGQLMQLRRALETTAPRGKQRRASGRTSVR